MTLPFGEGERAEVFKHSLFLVSCNRLVAAAIAAATLLVRAIPGGGGVQGGLNLFACCSLGTPRDHLDHPHVHTD